MTISMRCPACGTSDAMTSIAHSRRANFRGVSLQLPETLALTECTICKELFLDDTEADAYSAAIDAAYEAELRQRALRSIEQLTRVTTLRRLEELLHVSHGYLSKLRGESKAPSATLVGNLAMLAMQPAARLSELEQFWSLDKRTA
jgi:hypothetical protein